MSTLTQIKCDVCYKIKDPTKNHWITALIPRSGRIECVSFTKYEIVQDASNEYQQAVLDICSAGCAGTLVARWMEGRDLNLKEEKQEEVVANWTSKSGTF